MRERSWKPRVTGPENANPAVVDENPACVEDHRSERRPRRDLEHDEGVARILRGRENLDGTGRLADPRLDERPRRLVTIQKFLERPSNKGHGWVLGGHLWLTG